MNIRTILNYIVGCAVLMSLLLQPSYIFAQAQSQLIREEREKTPFDMSVSPPTAYLKINPGNTAVHSITIKNNGLQDMRVTPELVSFAPDGTTGNPTLSATTEFPYLNRDRTSFDPITLPAGATAQLTLHFSVPATAENREYPLTVLFTTVSNSPLSQPNLTPISGKVGSNIIVLVSDSDTLENIITVESFGKHHFIDSFSTLEFSPLIKNNSYAATVASGSAAINNWRGKKIAEYDIAPAVILGYSTRKIEPVSDTTTTRDSEGIRKFVYDSPFLIGPYSFSVFLPSGDPNNPVYTEQKIIVWALPMVLLGAVAATCFILAGYYYYKKKNSLF